MGCADSKHAEEAVHDVQKVQAQPKGPQPPPPRDRGDGRAYVDSNSNGAKAEAPTPPPPEPVKPKTPPVSAGQVVAAPSTSQAQLSAPQVSTAQLDKHDGKHGQQKERRAAAGSEAVRDQIRKLAVGAPTPGPNDKGKVEVYAVSDSEDESLEDERGFGTSGWSKPQEVTDAICEALKRNFVFKGIPESLLLEVVERMYGMSYKAGMVVLQQGALPKPDDCMYYLQSGETDVVISGAVDSKAQAGEERKIEGHTVRIPQRPGWVFGDVALLFHSPRTASVMARTNITVWALDRKTFLQFVMKHAQGARALRFLRKLPLLKGLSDNDLIRAASRMPQRVYEDGQAVIKAGERGDELYLIRYGKVKVMRPDGNGGAVAVATLGRGQFVGERAVINNRLRSADVVAQGRVQVVVMKKRDFMDLDNPLLTWMLDYDAIAACLRFVPQVKGLQQDQMEQLLERFDDREEHMAGHVMIQQGALLERLYVLKLGELKLLKNGEPAVDTTFLREAAGFYFFGEAALQAPFKCPYTVVVSSDSGHVLSLAKRAFDAFLGIDAGLNTPEAIVAALKKSKNMQNIPDSELKAIVQGSEETAYNAGDVIVAANSAVTNKVFMVKCGEVVLVAADMALPEAGQVDLGRVVERGRLLPGSLFNDEAVLSPETASLKASLVASSPGTTIISFTTQQVDQVTGGRARLQPAGQQKVTLQSVKFTDLEQHRIVGTGQFGFVRLVRNIKTNEVYALKAMHKAPIVETKQIEHVLNERKTLEEANHPLCVRLCGAYQDKTCLYLLQEWVPGGELFHHLDLEGAFDEPTAMFFAANVLLALEFLHNKGIVYRDLKPENLLLDSQGYIKVADFGFAKYIGDDKTYTICGTPDYQAPEVIMRRGTTKAADYWALGVLIFEMLVGDPPFKSLSGDPWDTFRRTLSGRFYVPNFISDSAADLIFKLLQVNPERRLGSGRDGAAEIKRHRWFSRIDWAALEAKRIPAPIRPKIRNPLDTSNFDNFDNCEVEPPVVPANRADRHTQWELWEWIDK